jgi:hypothetical protein
MQTSGCIPASPNGRLEREVREIVEAVEQLPPTRQQAFCDEIDRQAKWQVLVDEQRAFYTGDSATEAEGVWRQMLTNCEFLRSVTLLRSGEIVREWRAER